MTLEKFQFFSLSLILVFNILTLRSSLFLSFLSFFLKYCVKCSTIVFIFFRFTQILIFDLFISLLLFHSFDYFFYHLIVSTYFFIWLLICLIFIHLFIYLFINSFIYIFIYLFYLSICLFIYLFLYLLIY